MELEKQKISWNIGKKFRGHYWWNYALVVTAIYVHILQG